MPQPPDSVRANRIYATRKDTTELHIVSGMVEALRVADALDGLVTPGDPPSEAAPAPGGAAALRKVGSAAMSAITSARPEHRMQ